MEAYKSPMKKSTPANSVPGTENIKTSFCKELLSEDQNLATTIKGQKDMD